MPITRWIVDMLFQANDALFAALCRSKNCCFQLHRQPTTAQVTVLARTPSRLANHTAGNAAPRLTPSVIVILVQSCSCGSGSDLNILENAKIVSCTVLEENIGDCRSVDQFAEFMSALHSLLSN